MLFFKKYLSLLISIISGLIIILLILAWFFFYQTHFLPQTMFQDYNLSNLDFATARQKLEKAAKIPPDLKIILTAEDAKVASTSAQLGLSYNFDGILQQALINQKQLSFFSLVKNYFSSAPHKLQAQLISSQENLTEMLQILANRVDQPGKHGYIDVITKNKTNQIIIEPGQNEIYLDQQKSLALIFANLPNQTTFDLPVIKTNFALTPEEIITLNQQATDLLNKSITLTTDQVDNFDMILKASELVPLLGPTGETRKKLTDDILAQINSAVSRLPQEPVFDFDSTTKAINKFVPPLDGLALNQEEFLIQLQQNIQSLISSSEKNISFTLPLVVQKPQTALTNTNDLGVNELIGFGESYYSHSIPGRVHNVALTSTRINNTLVAPGEEFSFNRVLGEVSNATGFQPGYIIQGGRSVLSDGGGVCQVSTTLFRALLDSGLKITLRRPHSYRVSYYELNDDPGFDATVYSGNVDLRFVNDTSGYLLVTSEADNKQLYMNVKIYGTNDGRTTAVTNYKKFNAAAPPPTQYIPDASLAPGAKKQIDWAVAGLQTNFTHTIYNQDGSIRSQKDYPSTYQAWSNKFLVGP